MNFLKQQIDIEYIKHIILANVLNNFCNLYNEPIINILLNICKHRRYTSASSQATTHLKLVTQVENHLSNLIKNSPRQANHHIIIFFISLIFNLFWYKGDTTECILSKGYLCICFKTCHDNITYSEKKKMSIKINSQQTYLVHSHQ